MEITREMLLEHLDHHDPVLDYQDTTEFWDEVRSCPQCRKHEDDIDNMIDRHKEDDCG